MNYNEGDLVTYQVTEHLIRTVTVIQKDEIINGRSGFIGISNDGADYWGYDTQILQVQKDTGL